MRQWLDRKTINVQMEKSVNLKFLVKFEKTKAVTELYTMLKGV